jgi:hypothetical protein
LIKKEPPVVRAALRSTYSVIYFVLTVAILTENCPLIIRTTRTTTIRERLNKDGFMGCIFRPIIGGNGNKSRGKIMRFMAVAKSGLCRSGRHVALLSSDFATTML